MNQQITVIVVTCDREAYLRRCLRSLEAQERANFNVLIIDNGRTSDVSKALYPNRDVMIQSPSFTEKGELSISSAASKPVYIFKTEGNIGGAGGFALGIEITMQFLNSDFFVLMDDDGFFPDSRALGKLVDAHTGNNLDVTNALVCSDTSPEKLSFGLGKRIKLKTDAQHYADLRNILIEKANFFNGTMMSTALIQQTGNIKKEMFIWGDEIEFLLRLKQMGYKIGTAVEAILEHPEPKVQSIRVLGIFRVSLKPKHLALNLYRNVSYLKHQYGRKTGGLIWKHMIYYILKGDIGYARKIWQYANDLKYTLPPLISD